jgi:3-oxoadipate enol-lactonase
MTTLQSPPGAAAKFQVIDTASNEAPWIAMVHGVSQDHRVFDRQVNAFKNDYRLILIDLPGHGLSSEQAGPFGLREYADAVKGSLIQAGISSCHYWGTHLGAGTGLVLACDSPAFIKSLVLEGPVFPGRAMPAVSDVIDRVADIAREEGMEAAREVWWLEGGWFDVMRAHPDLCRAEEQWRLISEFSGTPWLDPGLFSKPLPPFDDAVGRLRCPVLIMNGEHDMPSFLEAADALEATLFDCRRATVAQAGGFPLWEFPDRVNPVVAAFLRNLVQWPHG